MDYTNILPRIRNKKNKVFFPYTRTTITTEQGLYFKMIERVKKHCKTYSSVDQVNLDDEGEIYIFKKSVDSKFTKGVLISRLQVNNGNKQEFYGYVVKVTFFTKTF